MNLFQIKDVAYVVSLHIKDSKTWLSFSLINKICAEVSHQRQSEVRKTLANHLWILVKRNPNKKWDWEGLSSNPNITWEIVQKNPNLPWKWSGLSSNHFIKN